MGIVKKPAIENRRKGYFIGTPRDFRPWIEEMSEGSAVCNWVIDSTANKDAINKFSHLHSQEWLGNAFGVANPIEWEKGVDDSRNVDRLKYVGHDDTIGSCMDKLSSGAIAVDEEVSGIVVVYGGAKAAGKWIEQI